MRVALVHECLTGYHGSERVLAALAALYPEAELFFTTCDATTLHQTPLAGRTVHTSWLERLPLLRRRPRWLLPLMPYAVEQHDLRDFDLILSSHHAAAHGIIARSDQLHLCYTHSPARYAWELYRDHLPPRKFAPLRRALLHRFRVWDQLAGLRVDAFAANSPTVARRIRRVYQQDAAVIAPPVEVSRFNPARPREDFYLVLGRWVPYKNAACVIDAFAGTQRELVLVGGGPLEKQLRRQALQQGVRARFITGADDRQVADHLERCRAAIFAAEEDFGIAAVEALAAGAPVLGLGRGGWADVCPPTLRPLMFTQPTGLAIRAAMERFEATDSAADRGASADTAAALHAHARRYDAPVFARAMQQWINDRWTAFHKDQA